MSDQSINFASPINDVCRAFFVLESIFGYETYSLYMDFQHVCVCVCVCVFGE